MARKNFSKATIARRFAHAGGRCEAVIGEERCNAVLIPGRWACDHDNPDGLTGEPTFENARALCHLCHAVKTKTDVKNIAQAKRREAKDIGADKAVASTKPKIQSPQFAAPQPKPLKSPTATGRIDKSALPPLPRPSLFVTEK